MHFDFFEESSATAIAATEGRADVIYAANTICHIPYLDSIFRGVDVLLADEGVFVFEDPYLGDIIEHSSFDQIYDEHFYFFSATSVQAAASRFGFELVNVERLPVHGGEVRYTIARQGRRTPQPSVAELIADEKRRGLVDTATLAKFGAKVEQNCQQLTALVRRLRQEGHTVAGYGATAKSATVLNYCGIGPDQITAVFDSTTAKQGLLTPGTHIPIRPMPQFAEPYPDYAVLFAWNHAEEIIAKEQAFRDQGGRWILYTPDVHLM